MSGTKAQRAAPHCPQGSRRREGPPPAAEQKPAGCLARPGLLLPPPCSTSDAGPSGDAGPSAARTGEPGTPARNARASPPKGTARLSGGEEGGYVHRRAWTDPPASAPSPTATARKRGARGPCMHGAGGGPRPRPAASIEETRPTWLRQEKCHNTDGGFAAPRNQGDIMSDLGPLGETDSAPRSPCRDPCCVSKEARCRCAGCGVRGECAAV